VTPATRKRKEVAEAALDRGLTPLEFMLDVLRDEDQDFTVRADMAKAAAPYIHPRLSATTLSAQGALTLEVISGVNGG
jgi:hypothetical protein